MTMDQLQASPDARGVLPPQAPEQPMSLDKSLKWVRINQCDWQGNSTNKPLDLPQIKGLQAGDQVKDCRFFPPDQDGSVTTVDNTGKAQPIQLEANRIQAARLSGREFPLAGQQVVLLHSTAVGADGRPAYWYLVNVSPSLTRDPKNFKDAQMAKTTEQLLQSKVFVQLHDFAGKPLLTQDGKHQQLGIPAVAGLPPRYQLRDCRNIAVTAQGVPLPDGGMIDIARILVATDVYPSRAVMLDGKRCVVVPSEKGYAYLVEMPLDIEQSYKHPQPQESLPPSPGILQIDGVESKRSPNSGAKVIQLHGAGGTDLNIRDLVSLNAIVNNQTDIMPPGWGMMEDRSTGVVILSGVDENGRIFDVRVNPGLFVNLKDLLAEAPLGTKLGVGRIESGADGTMQIVFPDAKRTIDSGALAESVRIALSQLAPDGEYVQFVAQVGQERFIGGLSRKNAEKIAQVSTFGGVQVDIAGQPSLDIAHLPQLNPEINWLRPRVSFSADYCDLQGGSVLLADKKSGEKANIPMLRFRDAYLDFQASPQNGFGTTQDIHYLRPMYDAQSGQLTSLSIGGYDIQTNNNYHILVQGLGLDQLIRIAPFLPSPDRVAQTGVSTAKGGSLMDRIRVNAPHIGVAVLPSVERAKEAIVNLFRPRPEAISGITPETVAQNLSIGRAEVSASNHEIHDFSGEGRVEYTISGKRYVGVRLVQADGAGGSVPKSLDQKEKDRLIREKTQAAVRAIIANSSDTPQAAMEKAHNQVKDMNDSIAGVVVVDIVCDEQGNYELIWGNLGDCSLLAFRADSEFKHRRSELPGVHLPDDYLSSGSFSRDVVDERLGQQSHFCAMTKDKNMAGLLRSVGSAPAPTAYLSVVNSANTIMPSMGSKNAQVVFVEHRMELKDLNADALVLVTDGVQPPAWLDASGRADPSVVIAESEERKRQNVSDYVQSGVSRPEAEKRAQQQAEIEIIGVNNQPLFAKQVEQLMRDMHEGKISSDEVAKQVVLLAGNVLQDQDDKSVIVVDLKRFRKP